MPVTRAASRRSREDDTERPSPAKKMKPATIGTTRLAPRKPRTPHKYPTAEAIRKVAPRKSATSKRGEFTSRSGRQRLSSPETGSWSRDGGWIRGNDDAGPSGRGGAEGAEDADYEHRTPRRSRPVCNLDRTPALEGEESASDSSSSSPFQHETPLNPRVNRHFSPTGILDLPVNITQSQRERLTSSSAPREEVSPTPGTQQYWLEHPADGAKERLFISSPGGPASSLPDLALLQRQPSGLLWTQLSLRSQVNDSEPGDVVGAKAGPEGHNASASAPERLLVPPSTAEVIASRSRTQIGPSLPEETSPDEDTDAKDVYQKPRRQKTYSKRGHYTYRHNRQMRPTYSQTIYNDAMRDREYTHISDSQPEEEGEDELSDLEWGSDGEVRTPSPLRKPLFPMSRAFSPSRFNVNAAQPPSARRGVTLPTVHEEDGPKGLRFTQSSGPKKETGSAQNHPKISPFKTPGTTIQGWRSAPAAPRAPLQTLTLKRGSPRTGFPVNTQLLKAAHRTGDMTLSAKTRKGHACGSTRKTQPKGPYPIRALSPPTQAIGSFPASSGSTATQNLERYRGAWQVRNAPRLLFGGERSSASATQTSAIAAASASPLLVPRASSPVVLVPARQMPLKSCLKKRPMESSPEPMRSSSPAPCSPPSALSADAELAFWGSSPPAPRVVMLRTTDGEEIEMPLGELEQLVLEEQPRGRHGPEELDLAEQDLAQQGNVLGAPEHRPEDKENVCSPFARSGLPKFCTPPPPPLSSRRPLADITPVPKRTSMAPETPLSGTGMTDYLLKLAHRDERSLSPTRGSPLYGRTRKLEERRMRVSAKRRGDGGACSSQQLLVAPSAPGSSGRMLAGADPRMEADASSNLSPLAQNLFMAPLMLSATEVSSSEGQDASSPHRGGVVPHPVLAAESPPESLSVLPPRSTKFAPRGGPWHSQPAPRGMRRVQSAGALAGPSTFGAGWASPGEWRERPPALETLPMPAFGVSPAAILPAVISSVAISPAALSPASISPPPIAPEPALTGSKAATPPPGKDEPPAALPATAATLAAQLLVPPSTSAFAARTQPIRALLYTQNPTCVAAPATAPQPSGPGTAHQAFHPPLRDGVSRPASPQPR